jgi:hypothetical protein
MTNHPTFKEVLRSVVADGYDGKLLNEELGYARWNKKLRDFVERWLASQTDSELWEGIATDGEKIGLRRRASFFRIAVAAITALFAGDPANVENLSPKALRLQSDQFAHLAQCAQSLAKHYRKRLKVFGPTDHESEARAQFYEEQAEEFRWASVEALEWASATSRQSGGTKFTREHLSFMRSLVDNMQRNFEKPNYNAVAAITAIAYPRKIVTAEEVRTVCRRLPVAGIPVRYSAPLYAATDKTLRETIEWQAVEGVGRQSTGKLDRK